MLDLWELEPSDEELQQISETEKEEVLEVTTEESIVLYMKLFFKNKTMNYGGPIPDNILYSRENVELVKRLDSVCSIDIAFEQIGYSKKSRHRLLNLFQECRKNGIPKSYAGGISLLYLEICEGQSIP